MKYNNPNQHYSVSLTEANIEAALFAYQSLQAAHMSVISIIEDPATALEFKPTLVDATIKANLAMKAVQTVFPNCSKKVFKREVKDADPLLFEDLKSAYLKMNKSQKEMLVMASDGILNNTFTLHEN